MAHIVGLCVFLSVICLYLGYRATQKERINILRRELESRYEQPEVKKHITIPLLSDMHQGMRKTGLDISFRDFLILVVVFMTLGYLTFSWLLSAGYGMAGAVVFLIALRIWIALRIKSRKQLIREQFSRTLIRISNLMKAHVSLEEAIFQSIDKTESPMKEELIRINSNYKTSNNIITALKQSIDFMPIDEYKLFVMSAEINREVGGDFAALLEKLVATVSDKQALAQKIQSYAAHGKMTGNIIGGLAIGAFLFFRIFIPEYIQPLLDSQLGLFILFYCIVSIALGWYIIRRMSDVSID